MRIPVSPTGHSGIRDGGLFCILSLVSELHNQSDIRLVGLTDRQDPITVTTMQLYIVIPFQRWVVGSLVLIWLSMGSLALAEQLHVVTETGPHDEQALEDLQLAVRSEAHDDSTSPLSPDLLHFNFTVATRAGTIDTSVVRNLICSFPGSPFTRSLARFTCCFRI